MQRLYIILFAVVLGIGSLFLFGALSPANASSAAHYPRWKNPKLDAR